MHENLTGITFQTTSMFVRFLLSNLNMKKKKKNAASLNTAMSDFKLT